nr:MAG TPA: D-ribitol-5-phosphate cytidylyltransferase C-terminal domain [Caudoviricetes sp.]
MLSCLVLLPFACYNFICFSNTKERRLQHGFI